MIFFLGRTATVNPKSAVASELTYDIDKDLYVLRIDDQNNPDFWMVVHLPAEELERAKTEATLLESEGEK